MLPGMQKKARCIESLLTLEVIYKGFPYSFLFMQIKFKYTKYVHYQQVLFNSFS